MRISKAANGGYLVMWFGADFVFQNFDELIVWMKQQFKE